MKIPELESYVKRKDVIGFLRQYLRLSVEGRSLELPASLDVADAKQRWLEILPGVVNGFSAEFVTKLSQYWFLLIKKQGRMEDDSFAKDLLDIVYNNPQSVYKTEIKSESKPVQPKPSEPVQTAQTPLTKEGILHTSKLYVQREDADSFLITYLSFVLLDIKPQLPLSTVHDVISTQWEGIIARELKCSASPVFLLKASSTWFYVVHLKGLPTTLEKTREIYDYLVSRRKVSPIDPSKRQRPTQTFWQKWFR